MDIVVWMRSLGLGRYEAAFRENDIDETVLSSLTHETLKELGVTAVGHRLKLLDAIAVLRNDTNGKAPSVGAATTSSAPSAHPEDRAERRQVRRAVIIARTTWFAPRWLTSALIHRPITTSRLSSCLTSTNHSIWRGSIQWG